MVGWSRGGVTAIVLSHLIAADDWLGQCEVNVLAIDPVPGGHSTDRRFVTLPARLRQFVGIYALSDRSNMFAPTVPVVAHGSGTLYELDGIVGAHATLVGAQHANLSRPTGPIACAVAERSFMRWNCEPIRNTASTPPLSACASGAASMSTTTGADIQEQPKNFEKKRVIRFNCALCIVLVHYASLGVANLGV